MTRRIAVVTAGIGTPSSSRLLADRLAAATARPLRAAGVPVEVEVIELREHARELADHLVTGFPPGSLRPALDAVSGADAVIAVTPVFAASYSGLFKTFFDVLEPDALAGTPVLLAATAGTARHSLVLEHAMRPLFSYLRALVVPTAVFAAPEDWAAGDAAPLSDRIERAAAELADLVASRPPVRRGDPHAQPTRSRSCWPRPAEVTRTGERRRLKRHRVMPFDRRRRVPGRTPRRGEGPHSERQGHRVKRARVAAAVAAAGVATVVGISLLTPAGANPALPVVVSDNPADYTPAVNGGECFDDNVAADCRRVRDMTRIGDTLYAGGVIDSVTDRTTGATTTGFGNALLFNARTGAVRTDLKPQFTDTAGTIQGGQINAVERSTLGSAVWFGGEFKRLNGVTNRGLIRWDVASNKQYTAFNANIGADGKTSRVYDVKYFCNRLWVAGDFTSAGGATRTALISLDPTTGAATNQVNLGISGTANSTAGPTRVTKIAPSPDCKRVVIIGNFTRISNQERYQMAVLNVSPTSGAATLAPWYSPYHLRASQPGVGANSCTTTTVPVWVRDIDWAPDGTWWALASTGGHHPYPSLCDSVSRWTNNDSTDARPVWINYSGGDTFLSVRVTGQQVYVGGHFRLLDEAVYRNGVKVGFTGHEHWGLGVLAATASSGMSIPGWNDGATTGRGFGWAGMLVNPGPSGSGSGLWVGGDSDVIKGEHGKRIGLLPIP